MITCNIKIVRHTNAYVFLWESVIFLQNKRTTQALFRSDDDFVVDDCILCTHDMN